MRAGLERLRHDPEKEDKLVAYSRADAEFHSLLLEKAGNLVLKNMMEVVNAHLQLIRLRTVVLPGRARQTVAEHEKVLEALEQGDEKAAEELMRHHIRSVREDAIRNIHRME